MLPGRILFITRRCTQRQYLLRPDPVTNNAFTYLIGEAAQRFGMHVVLPQMQSNHHHGIVYDPHGNEVAFREHFHKMMAKVQNAHLGRWENLWSSEEPCTIEVMSPEDLLDKLVYVATNPVKDGLVERVHHWPGPNFVGALLSGKTMRATRPKHFFSETGTMPEEIELSLSIPSEIIDDIPEFLARLQRRIELAEVQFAEERQRAGRCVLGRRAVKRQSWRDSPDSREPRRGVRPRVAARNTWARVAALQRDKAWEEDYRCARLLWLAGFPAEFPHGTYWLRRFARVTVRPPN